MYVYTYILLTLFFKYFFRVVLGLQQNREEGPEMPHVLPAPTLCIINILHQAVDLHIIDEMASMGHSHSKSTVYVTLHPWHCTFYRFRQMSNDMCPSL